MDPQGFAIASLLLVKVWVHKWPTYSVADLAWKIWGTSWKRSGLRPLFPYRVHLRLFRLSHFEKKCSPAIHFLLSSFLLFFWCLWFFFFQNKKGYKRSCCNSRKTPRSHWGTLLPFSLIVSWYKVVSCQSINQSITYLTRYVKELKNSFKLRTCLNKIYNNYGCIILFNFKTTQ